MLSILIKKERKLIMKKKVLALLLATAMISTFVACGEEKAPAADTSNDAATGDEVAGDDSAATEDEAITCTITVWAPSEDQSEENPWLQTQCAAFAAEHPSWNITFN